MSWPHSILNIGALSCTAHPLACSKWFQFGIGGWRAGWLRVSKMDWPWYMDDAAWGYALAGPAKWQLSMTYSGHSRWCLPFSLVSVDAIYYDKSSHEGWIMSNGHAYIMYPFEGEMAHLAHHASSEDRDNVGLGCLLHGSMLIGGYYQS